MTFDEAMKEVKEHDFTYDETSGTMQTFSVLDILDELRQEYAPEIEMTKSENDKMLSSIKFGLNFINFYEWVTHQSTAIKFGTQTTPELYKSFSESQLMQAWLHPETIKVIG